MTAIRTMDTTPNVSETYRRSRYSLNLKATPGSHVKIILRRYHCATETIVAAQYDDHHGTYQYGVYILGGKHHGIEIQCRTEDSALALFEKVVAVRKADDDWNWLDRVESL